MKLKDKILEILEQNRDVHISGQDLAMRLMVSRNAVWKNVKILEEGGHKIEAIRNKGYRLEDDSDKLSQEGIRIHLGKTGNSYDLLVLDTIDSTNDQGKRMIAEGCRKETIIIANEQISGRGRQGRKFQSPKDTGMYLSLLFYPNKNMEEMENITTKTCVAVCRTIEEVSTSNAEIKWVNDIFVDGLKVSGILTEAVTDFESGTVEALVIGIGINLRTRREDFDEDIRGIAGSIFPKVGNRNKIAARLIDNVLEVYENGDEEELMAEYRRRCFLLGKKISYRKNGEMVEALALDVNEKGNLVIIGEDGRREILNSGEVSLKKEKEKEKEKEQE